MVFIIWELQGEAWTKSGKEWRNHTMQWNWCWGIAGIAVGQGLLTTECQQQREVEHSQKHKTKLKVELKLRLGLAAVPQLCIITGSRWSLRQMNLALCWERQHSEMRPGEAEAAWAWADFSKETSKRWDFGLSGAGSRASVACAGICVSSIMQKWQYPAPIKGCSSADVWAVLGGAA